jgi:Na+-driven multidrug efflux pump
LTVTLVFYYTKEEVVSALTDIPTVYEKALGMIWLLMFNTFPELFKGINKGVIRGLNLQAKSVYIHLSGNWVLNGCL